MGMGAQGELFLQRYHSWRVRPSPSTLLPTETAEVTVTSCSLSKPQVAEVSQAGLDSILSRIMCLLF